MSALASRAPAPETAPEPTAATEAPIRADLRLIADLIEPRCRVLDIGCSDGSLLAHLWRTKGVDGRGIELSMNGVRDCVAQGLSVIQGDADTDLSNYPTDAFDYAVLSQTIQATRNPRSVLDDLVRIGRRAIVSFPNFGYWRVRLALMTSGRMPVTRYLADQWYDTPNIHFCTVRDMELLCLEMGIGIERSFVVLNSGRVVARPPTRWANLFGRDAIFLLRRT